MGRSRPNEPLARLAFQNHPQGVVLKPLGDTPLRGCRLSGDFETLDLRRGSRNRQKCSLGAFLTGVDPSGRPANRAFGSICLKNPYGIFDQFEALLRIERHSAKSLSWDFAECQNRSFERF